MLTGYYQKNKETLQKRLVKVIKILLKNKKAKSVNMIANKKEIFQKMKNKGKVIAECKKMILLLMIRDCCMK